MCSWHYFNAAQGPVSFSLRSEITCLNSVQKLIDRLPRHSRFLPWVIHLLGSKVPTTFSGFPFAELVCSLTVVQLVDFAHSQPTELPWLGISAQLSQAASKSLVELAHAAIVWLHELLGILPNPARSTRQIDQLH